MLGASIGCIPSMLLAEARSKTTVRALPPLSPVCSVQHCRRAFVSHSAIPDAVLPTYQALGKYSITARICNAMRPRPHITHASMRASSLEKPIGRFSEAAGCTSKPARRHALASSASMRDASTLF
jgi:hypothetical protein